MIEELKQRLIAKAQKIRRYDQRREQYQQNRLFLTDQKKFYLQLSGIKKEKVVPNALESVRF